MNFGADQQQLQISDNHFDKFTMPATLACWKKKVQDRGMYLFTISYGSYALNQRSGDGWFSGWFKIFAIYSSYFNAKFWSTWCEDCFSAEQNHPSFLIQKKNQSERTKRPRKRTVSFAEDRLLSWSTSTSGSQEPMILSRILPTWFIIALRNDDIQEFDSEWDGNLFSMTKSHLMTSWKDCTVPRRVWETHDHIVIVCPGDSSEESSTWLSQIEDDGVKKYRAEFTNCYFWSQTLKLWKKRRGQESGDKTAWTKNSWRLLAMGNQRAVF